MASNQVSNQRNRTGNTHLPAQTGASSVSHGEDSQTNYGAAGKIAEQASDYLAKGAGQVREMTRDREGTAVAVALAAGLGVGLVVGAALVRSQRRQLSWRDRVTAEGFGRRLMERIESMIPDALTEHFTK